MELKIYCDGGSRGNPGPAASAFVIFQGEKVVARVGKFLGETTNNQAEYQAVLFSLRFIEEKGWRPTKISFLLDSELIVKQMKGEYRIKDLRLQKHAIAIRDLERGFGINISFQHIPRSQNRLADQLVNQVLDARKI